ncbi:pyruvate dehydrogenase E1 component alpha subunit [Rhodococcus rhodochrous J45]|uniref:Pyruvate dehydrogenase E1 component alpha subunit n=1 Tax=Rhodococcus rhodochrous J45 TaxID=935266 RepID=A0A562DJ41_RHORH|nr:thiamine pyrophosphate-dependent dehydrogenase E1 component subunit alpha [Rhodococcus rhodochrous]TWH09564.1 pyruvate dehydrogenase E1 component alpha subunit [Rhodococcus rhodochrous J45]
MGKLDDEQLRTMLTRMAQARAIDKIITEHTKEHRFDGYWHPGEGQEAAPIGATAALRDDDYLAYHFRGSAWALGKGMPLEPVIGDIFGRTTGSTGGKGAGSPKWADPAIGLLGEGGTLGSAFVVAGGAALAIDIRGTDQVAVAAFGDATSARGTFHETLLQASVWNLPLIYFCENNHWQVATPFEAWSPTKTVAERGAAYGVPGLEVDGQDAQAVHEAMSVAVARARAGGGPTIVEAHVTRARGHYEGDLHRADMSSYRDPIDVLANRVKNADEIIKQAEADVRAEYAKALDAPVADPDILWKDVFA